MLLLKYEDLVHNSDAEMEKIFDFLELAAKGVKWEGTHQFQNVDSKEFSIPLAHEERFKKKYADLSQPVYTKRHDAWKTELSKDEITACDTICRKLGAELGYEPQIKSTTSSLKYFKFYLKALREICKEELIYYISPAIKLKRLKKVYTRLGLAKK